MLQHMQIVLEQIVLEQIVLDIQHVPGHGPCVERKTSKAMRDDQQVVKDVAVQPDEQIFVSVGKDSTARFLDINDQCMIDCIYLDKPERSAIL